MAALQHFCRDPSRKRWRSGKITGVGSGRVHGYTYITLAGTDDVTGRTAALELNDAELDDLIGLLTHHRNNR